MSSTKSFLLSMSYAPEFCALHPDQQNSQECTGKYNLVLHGLWPQFVDKFDTHTYTNNDIISFVESIDGWADVAPEYSTLAPHEWNNHGKVSGMTMNDYFSLAFDLAKKIPNHDLTSLSKSDIQKLYPDGDLIFDSESGIREIRFKITHPLQTHISPSSCNSRNHHC